MPLKVEKKALVQYLHIYPEFFPISFFLFNSKA